MLRRTLLSPSRLFSRTMSTARYSPRSFSLPRELVYVFDKDGTTVGSGGKLVKDTFTALFWEKARVILTHALMLEKMGTRKDLHIKSMLRTLWPEWKNQYPDCNEVELEKLFDHTVQEIYQGFNKKILAGLAEGCKPIPAKVDVINELRKQGNKIAYTSGFPLTIMQELMANSVYPKDSVYVASDQVSNGRPAPDMLLKIMMDPRINCIDPSRVVNVDDMKYGTFMGKNLAKKVGKPCWTVFDLTDSCMLEHHYVGESENSSNLQRQRKDLIEKLIPGEVDPDYVVISATGLFAVDQDIRQRLLCGSVPGDTATKIAGKNSLEVLDKFYPTQKRRFG